MQQALSPRRSVKSHVEWEKPADAAHMFTQRITLCSRRKQKITKKRKGWHASVPDWGQKSSRCKLQQRPCIGDAVQHDTAQNSNQTEMRGRQADLRHEHRTIAIHAVAKERSETTHPHQRIQILAQAWHKQESRRQAPTHASHRRGTHLAQALRHA